MCINSTISVSFLFARASQKAGSRLLDEIEFEWQLYEPFITIISSYALSCPQGENA